MTAAAIQGHSRLDEAEGVLVSAYEAYKGTVTRVPAPVRQAAETLAKGYEATNQPDEAARWRARFAAGAP